MNDRDYKYRQLEKSATGIRLKILNMANRSKGSHVGSCLSCVDVVVFLYHELLRMDGSDPTSPNRDYFIMSKGHAAMTLYAVLAERGIFPEELLAGYMLDNGTLPAHLDRFSGPGIEVSSGALGHGLPMGLGIAHGLKLKKKSNKVYVLMGDGESQEGSVWEAAMMAPKLGVDNLVAIIDHNNLQGYGRPSDIMSFRPVAEKWRAFGWKAWEADGHDFESMAEAFGRAESASGPAVVILNSIKGKGVSFMEDELKWHYFIVTDDLLQKAKSELGDA